MRPRPWPIGKGQHPLGGHARRHGLVVFDRTIQDPETQSVRSSNVGKGMKALGFPARTSNPVRTIAVGRLKRKAAARSGVMNMPQTIASIRPLASS